MQSNDAKEPSGDLPSHEHPETHPAPGQPGRGAHSMKRFKGPALATQAGHPKPSVQTEPSQKPTDPLLPKPPEPGTLSKSEKAAIRNRAVGRTKVPSKFRDSIKRFFFSPTGALKILRLGLLIGSAVCFLIAEAHESYIVITVLETCIVLFFILVYMVALHRLTNFIHWALLILRILCSLYLVLFPRGVLQIWSQDLINSFITTVFLLIVAVLAMREKERRHLFYVGGSLCLSAVIVCLIDATVVTKKMRNLMKTALRLEGEISSSKPAPESQEVLIPTPSPAPVRAPSPTPSKAPL